MKGLLLLSALSASAVKVLGDSSGIGTSASNVAFQKPDGIKGGDIEHRSALFGASDFGKANQLFARVEIDQQEKSGSDGMSGGCPTADTTIGGSKILVVDGYESCSFVMEALNAQRRNAVALIVVENKCLAKNANKGPESWKKHCQKVGVVDEISYMGGADNAVQIPAMIISRWDGLRLIECQKMVSNSSFKKEDSITGVDCAYNGDAPLVSIRWNIPQQSTVNWILWTSSLLNADIFVKEYWHQDVMPELVKKTSFTPRYFVWDGDELGCTGANGEAHCKDACHNKGRYCHFDPDGLGAGKNSGMYLSQENLRQFCAYQQVRDSSDKSDQIKWWKYIYLVAEFCSGKNDNSPFANEPLYYSEKCSKYYHEQAKLSWDATMGCIQSSGSYDAAADRKNTLWENELTERKKLSFQRLPTLVVNDRVVDFGTSLKNVLVAMCAGYEEKSQPGYCPCVLGDDQTLFSDKTLVDRCFKKIPAPTAAPDNGDNSSGSGVDFFTFFIVLFLVVGGLVATFFIMRERDRKRLRYEFHEDVRNIMGEYMRMDQDDGADDSAASSFVGSGQRNNNQYQHVVELS